MWHGYFAVEDINLSPSQRQTLITVLRKLGPVGDPRPQMRNHWRTRLDGKAAIFEALFNESLLTVDAFKNRLGAIFGVDPVTIDHSASSSTFDKLPTPIVMFSRGGTNYLRFAAFGGVHSGWMDSGDEARAYLAANSDEWELLDD